MLLKVFYRTLWSQSIKFLSSSNKIWSNLPRLTVTLIDFQNLLFPFWLFFPCIVINLIEKLTLKSWQFDPTSTATAHIQPELIWKDAGGPPGWQSNRHLGLDGKHNSSKAFQTDFVSKFGILSLNSSRPSPFTNTIISPFYCRSGDWCPSQWSNSEHMVFWQHYIWFFGNNFEHYVTPFSMVFRLINPKLLSSPSHDQRNISISPLSFIHNLFRCFQIYLFIFHKLNSYRFNVFPHLKKIDCSLNHLKLFLFTF